MERISLVTGANRGIGLEVARQLAMRGFTTILGARDAQKGKRASSLLQQSGLEVIPVQLDVTEQKSIDGARQIVEERFGKLDVLVNNAAILYDSWQRAENANLDTVLEAFDTNTLGAWRQRPQDCRRRGGQCHVGGDAPGRWADGRVLPRWQTAPLVRIGNCFSFLSRRSATCRRR